jgi:GT2 family glycosyltransferase
VIEQLSNPGMHLSTTVAEVATINKSERPGTQPLVSVVLLSYNRPQLLDKALASLQQQSYENLTITVIDNSSAASAEIAHLLTRYPEVQLIQTELNLGYAGGMNRGIAMAAGDYVCLTEDDIVLEQDCIQKLADHSETSNIDLLAPIIYNESARTIRCAGGELSLGGIYRRTIHGSNESDVGQFREPFDVGYVDGAVMFARKEFWKRFKGFREEFFMYVDAVELCARVTRAGCRMTIVPQAKVYHFEPVAAPTPPELEFHKLKNFFSLHLLHAPARHLPEFFCRYAIINGIRTLFKRTGNSPQVFFKALLWVLRRTPSLLKERRMRRDCPN